MHPPEWRFFLGIRAGLFERLEQWTKATVGAVGILYVLGFLVHTLYLGSYGITVVNLLRTQYILAGAWLMMPPVLLCALGVFVFSVVEDRRDPKKGRIRAAAGGILMFAVLIFVAILPLWPVFDMPPRVTGHALWWLFLALYGAGAFLYGGLIVRHEVPVRRWSHSI